MRNHIILLSLFASLTATGCKALECAEGTVERDGQCVPGDTITGSAICGEFTELVGDRCVPEFPPTQCEPGTTEEEADENGVIICKGMGGSALCGTPISCPTPTGSKQTICGQLYDFETGAELRATPTTMMAVPCNPTMPASSGPCALQILAYDAIAFGTNPMAAQPLTVGNVLIDECGRYKVQDIETNGTGPFIGLGVDDAGMALGPGGTTVTAAVATPKQGAFATKNLEAFIVKASTTQTWANSGGPPLSGGIYAPVFRAHKVGIGNQFEPQAGVTVTKSGNTIPANDFYFTAAQTTTRQAIDAAATATGMNGTVLVTNASVNDSVAYGGSGGISPTCRWEPHAGASLPGIVFIQIFRKIDAVGMTCND